MLVGLLKFLFNVAGWLLYIGSWLVVIYTILLWVIPQNKYVRLVGKYLEPVLAMVRGGVRRVFPNFTQTRLDFSPAVLCLLLIVARWVLQLLQNILL